MSSALVEMCAICGDASHGVHFGVVSCRACSAFFRRSTISNRKYHCRYGGNCAVGKDVRCSCRACRLKKCFELGMNAGAVQRFRDSIGPRRKRSSHSTSSDNYRSESELGSPLDLTSSKVLTAISPVDVMSPSVLPNNGEKGGKIVAVHSSEQMHYRDGKSYALLTGVQSTSAGNNHIDSAIVTNAVTSSQVAASSNSSAFSAITSAYNGDVTRHYSVTLTTDIATAHIPSTSLQMAAESSPSTPLISEMLKGYRKFCCLRRTANTLNTNGGIHKLFDDKLELTPGTYWDNIASLKEGLSLISEMVDSHFPPLMNYFSTDAKWSLLRNFFCPFTALERSYFSTQNFPEKDDPRFLISCRHYSRLDQLTTFFDVDACKVEPERVANIFLPMFTHILKMIMNPMRELRLSDGEFVGLAGIVFWNDQTPGLSEEELKLLVQTRETLFNQLYLLCRSRAGTLCDGVRFARLCYLMQISHKIAADLGTNFSLVKALNVFDVDNFLHELIAQSF